MLKFFQKSRFSHDEGIILEVLVEGIGYGLIDVHVVCYFLIYLFHFIIQMDFSILDVLFFIVHWLLA